MTSIWGDSFASGFVTVLICVALPVAFSCRRSSPRLVSTPASTQNSLHWRRRLQHAACGLAIASGYKWFITDALIVVLLLSMFSAFFLALHKLRSRRKAINDVYLGVFGPLLRPHEVKGLPGAYWFLLGSACAVALFPRDVALQSILHLSTGDPVASVAGITMGERNRVLPAGKSLAGSMAAFFACATSTLMIFAWSRAEAMEDCDGSHASEFFGAFNECIVSSTCEGNGSSIGINSASRCCSLLGYVILGGVSGAVGEFLPLGVDDNLSMPMVSGTIFLLCHHVHMGMWQDGLL